jgi:hypothetical protein
MTSLRFNDKWRIFHWSCGASRGHWSFVIVLNAKPHQGGAATRK